ncbi:TGFB1 factor, partial [Grantiella picta]|nr:TGFB1 factor [Grantiella picta]
LLLLLLPCPSLPLSSCRSLDLDLARLKRIEAVRGQILSKLRLPEPPGGAPGEGETEELRALPEELRALYNSTRELLRQRSRERSREEEEEQEEYYAKELLRFPMETPGEGELSR